MTDDKGGQWASILGPIWVMFSRVKHASGETLRQLSDLLDQIRQRQGLKEKKLGIFYNKSKSFLHFHEDPTGIFADISSGDQFRRYSVNTTKERHALLTAIDRALK
jgi:hypothetical protein